MACIDGVSPFDFPCVEVNDGVNHQKMAAEAWWGICATRVNSPPAGSERSQILGCNYAVDSRFGIGLRFGRNFWTISNTFSKYEVHVGDADKAKEGGQIRRNQIGRRIFMNTTAAGQYYRTFTGDRLPDLSRCNGR